MEYIDTLYDVCEALMRELDKANDKMKKGGNNLTAGDLEYLDKITHAIKSVKTTIAMEEASYDDGGSYDGGSYNRGGRSYDGGSYARGRGRNARRDSMGRYTRDGRSYGYSRDDAKEELMEHLREMKKMAKDEETRRMVSEWEHDIERS